jgi:coiled-coil domain-containing protein 39
VKLLRDDLHRITLELKERSVKVEKLQAKHETLSAKGGRDENGEPKSQAYYLIKVSLTQFCIT